MIKFVKQNHKAMRLYWNYGKEHQFKK